MKTEPVAEKAEPAAPVRRVIPANVIRPAQPGEPVTRTYVPQGARSGAQRTYTPADKKPAGGYQPRQGAGQTRPQSAGGMNKGAGFKDKFVASPIIPTKDTSKQKRKDKPEAEKNKTNAMTKRTLIRKGFIDDGSYIDDEDRMGTRRKIRRKSQQDFTPAPVVIDKAVITTDNLTVKMLSEKIGKTVAEILKHLFNLGIITNINGNIDFDTAELVASEYNIELVRKVEKTKEEVLMESHEEEAEDSDKLVVRPPVVTIMGHVDHGKTSVLDYIRKADVAAGEAGGITQHIGAYTVSLDGQPITFLDTPGHEAFTSMRERGAQVTDIAVIVVAWDDGIMPQTIEAINHAKAAGVSIIVAINKMDKNGSRTDRVLQQLTEHELTPEEWGGDTIVVPVSARTGEGIDKLLESILLVAEIKELKANPDRSAKGAIIEAKLDKGRGPVATVLVQHGTLKVGDFVVAGTAVGRIRAMIDDKGRTVKTAGPSVPVSVLGFSEVPNAGDQIMAVADEKLSKQVAEERRDREKIEKAKMSPKLNLDDVFSKISDGNAVQLNLIVKADVQGSVEAIKQSLEKLGNEEVKVSVIHGAVGAINESDIMLAGTSDAIVIGFNVRPDTNAKALAEKRGVEVRMYRVIYDAIDDVNAAIKGKLAPKFRESILGHAEVRDTFRVSGVGTIAGSYVLEGKILRNSKLRLVRDNIVIYEGEVSSLKRFKDDVKEVATGYECGIGIQGYNDLKVGDIIESFQLVQEEV